VRREMGRDHPRLGLSSWYSNAVKISLRRREQQGNFSTVMFLLELICG
jgi:hypothetical protein